MNMERKYIQVVLGDLEERLDYVRDMKNDYEKQVEECEVGSHLAGLYKGHVMAYKTEMEFLERKIKFLSGALE